MDSSSPVDPVYNDLTDQHIVGLIVIVLASAGLARVPFWAVRST